MRGPEGHGWRTSAPTWPGGKQPRWPYTILGAGFALLGVAFVGFGLMRQRQVEAAIARGEFAPPNEVVIAVFAATSMLLGVALFVLVVAT